MLKPSRLSRGLRFASQTPPRDTRYARINDADLKNFEKILGKSYVKTEEIDSFNKDWTKWYSGNGACVLLPSTSEEISAILRHCHERRIAVVPQAGNTGLVGGGIPVHDEVILSVRRMNREFDFDPDTGVLSCDVGHVLEELEGKVGEFGYMMPFDLGAKGSCLIGGNLSTCAGGIRLLRYGSLHSHLLGLRVVLPDAKGSLVEFGSELRKDNTSLHAHHLFLGSEGQLGVITGVKMTCVTKPISVQSAMLGVNTFDECRKILRIAKTKLGEILSSFELMDRETIGVLEDNLQFSNVIKTNPRFNILVETSGTNIDHDREKVDNFLEYCLSERLANDGVQAKSAEEHRLMWRLRESATIALTLDGIVFKNDFSLPLHSFYQLTEEVRARVGGAAKRVVCYGHMGDGNSHLNVTSTKENADRVYKMLYPFVYEWVVKHGGSISAEHGIGQLKRPYVNLGKSTEERNLIRSLKTLFDPREILNPYKFL
ncbi:unnamed protein product, partial [Mesorhabditis belari]|uniref:D-2-hydroxyglutarate dehydrogenase, mitochondrial n=1 Tax=Mesorhabditis belari TaxID=2138241 RepID=A0AAF3EF72_9BILA